MKNLLIIAAISLATMAPLFAQKTPAQPFLRSYDELREAQQKEIMHTWNVVGTPQPLLSSYDELHAAQQQKTMRTWNAVEVVRGTTAPEVSGATEDYLDQNIEQINMNAAIETAIEF
jgi:hypothetical protein